MRNYNKEIQDNTGRKYAYGFDFDIMHPLMMRSFKPFFVAGSALELGCYQGAFTRRLLERFDDLTCIEASSEACCLAEKSINDSRVTFINALFEDVKLDKKYDNIFLTHVLEHIDDRIGLLKKINDEWLSDNGVLFIACPNANAPSRQIAVKMGLIEHNAAVTPAEAAHGHRVTYSLDTLAADIKKSGLNSTFSSGIFFKALANFQWDKLLETDIISDDYLEGCYQLGMQYPDLCSSIFFVCQKDSQI